MLSAEPRVATRVTASAAITERLSDWLSGNAESLVQLRRQLHAHPEPSGEEFGTARLLAGRLARAGLRPVLLPKGNGVICDIGPGLGGSGRTIALRADIDALPLHDLKDVPYRSQVDGVCHGCGHDVHSSVLAGVGLFLAKVREQLPGTVRLIFQPAEEILPCGALEVIEAGGLDGVSEIFAVHCDPKLLVGEIGLRVGALTAAADNLTVRLKGPGGHTARPHLTVDLVHALGRLVTEVPALLSRRVDARHGVLLAFGEVKAGTVANVIPGEGYAAGIVRMLDQSAWESAPDLVVRIVREVMAPTDATVDIDYQRGRPPVINSATSIRTLAGATAAALGEHAVADTPQSMGGEDFSWYLQQIPGAMARLGVGRADVDIDLDLHQGTFDVDERAIAVGVQVLTHTAVDALFA